MSERGESLILFKKYKFYIITFLVLASVILTISNSSHFHRSLQSIALHDEQDFKVTLLEAYKIGQLKAIKWDPMAKLYLISSVDGESGSNQGYDGKRRYWNMIFSVPGSPKSIIYTLHDKEIINTIPSEDMTNYEEVFESLDGIKDSSDIVEEAKRDLNPAKGWATGLYICTKYEFCEYDVQ
ncbi:hypothetical protein [Paenibacillus aceti]|nr:hypothetical protein [Paenibacillus aceti]